MHGCMSLDIGGTSSPFIFSVSSLIWWDNLWYSSFGNIPVYNISGGVKCLGSCRSVMKGRGISPAFARIGCVLNG